MEYKKIDKKSYDGSKSNTLHLDEPLQFEKPKPISETFTRTWKNADTEPPKEGNRYWCLVEEINDLGKSYFQWNCYYNKSKDVWSDNLEEMRVVYWTELAPRPF